MSNSPARPYLSVEKVAAWLFVAGVAVVSLIYFSDFLQPFVVAMMVWYFIYILKEFAGRIQIRGKRLPEWLLTTLAFIVIVLATFGVVEMVTYNLELIIVRFPAYIDNSRTLLESIRTIDGFEMVQERFIGRIEDFDFKPMLTSLLNSLSGIAGNIFMIIIYVGFMLAEEKAFNKKIHYMVANNARGGDAGYILREVNDAVKTYVFVKTQMSLLTGLLSYFILLAFGVDFPLLWAFLIFFLNFIPYIGSLVATLLPALFVIFQFQSFTMFLWVFAMIQVVQVMVGNVLEPKVMGRTLNLSPLGVLLALTFWGILWGVLGMIISVPITSILVITASRIPSMRFVAVLLSEKGELHLEDTTKTDSDDQSASSFSKISDNAS